MTTSDGLVIVDGFGAQWLIAPQGDRTVLLAHPSDGTPDVAVGRKCADVAAYLRAASVQGVSDIVPAFNTVALHFQPRLFGTSPSLKSLAAQIQLALNALPLNASAPDASRSIEIPVCYGGQHGPDLPDVASLCGISEAEVISLHSDNSAYVFMLGFAPGAPYIGLHDERLTIGRRATPRLLLPAGSVAMANRQTIIYPNASPGGWHVIGATPVSLFNPNVDTPALLNVGDTIRFVPITAEEFQALQATPS